MAKNTYKSPAFRATKIGTDPAETLNHLLTKYLPALVRKGHRAIPTIESLLNISYFPTKSEKQEWELKPIIKYKYSETRPTKQQLQPLQIKDYHLISNLHLAPLKGALCYQPPHKQANHTYHLCGNATCNDCRKYEVIMDNNLNTQIIPSTHLRCTFLLYTTKATSENQHLYIDQSCLANLSIDKLVEVKGISKLLKGRNIKWQILTLHNSTYKKPHRTIDPQIEEWKRKWIKKVPEAKVHTFPHLTRFFENTTIT